MAARLGDRMTPRTMPYAGPLTAVMLAVTLIAAPLSAADGAPCQRPTVACPRIARLLAGREGYGRAATGGLGGRFAVVTSNANSGPGSLRAVLGSASGPLWIEFASDMVIDLADDIPIPSNTTI